MNKGRISNPKNQLRVLFNLSSMLVLLKVKEKVVPLVVVNLEVDPIGKQKMQMVENGVIISKGETIPMEIISKGNAIKIPIKKGVEFAIVVVMLIKIVGYGENHNVTIAKNLSMPKKIVGLKPINKLKIGRAHV